MIAFPNAKINLGLNIVRKRDDGYHDLETLFYPIALRDALEIIPMAASTIQPAHVNLHLSGKSVEGPVHSNICVKAWRLLKNDFPNISGIDLHLFKAIPMGAGLGGGSADGSFTLKMLNDIFSLCLAGEALESYALELGSDCPFFIRNAPSFASGRGEIMTASSLDLSAYSLILVHPGIHVSTAVAFSGVEPSIPELSVSDILSMNMESWKGQLVNDFEKTVFPVFPAIEALRDRLYDAGAIYAAMTGSGSSVFGIFPRNGLPELMFPEGHTVFIQESLTPII
jgi:4-diphosphocytidyl-2-C-methyl-D-erythritol kinase